MLWPAFIAPPALDRQAAGYMIARTPDEQAPLDRPHPLPARRPARKRKRAQDAQHGAFTTSSGMDHRGLHSQRLLVEEQRCVWLALLLFMHSLTPGL